MQREGNKESLLTSLSWKYAAENPGKQSLLEFLEWTIREEKSVSW